MNLPFEYDRVAVGEFGGTTPTTTDFEHARVVILPMPLDRTTSYVPGTRNGPHEILVASSHMELWDEETETDVHSIGIFTLPEMEFPFATIDEVMREIRPGGGGARLARTSFRSSWAASTRLRRRSSRRSRRDTPGCRCCRSTPMPTCATRSWGPRDPKSLGTATTSWCSTRSNKRAATAPASPRSASRRRRPPSATAHRASGPTKASRSTAARVSRTVAHSRGAPARTARRPRPPGEASRRVRLSR